MVTGAVDGMKDVVEPPLVRIETVAARLDTAAKRLDGFVLYIALLGGAVAALIIVLILLGRRFSRRIAAWEAIRARRVLGFTKAILYH